MIFSGEITRRSRFFQQWPSPPVAEACRHDFCSDRSELIQAGQSQPNRTAAASLSAAVKSIIGISPADAMSVASDRECRLDFELEVGESGTGTLQEAISVPVVAWASGDQLVAASKENVAKTALGNPAILNNVR